MQAGRRALKINDLRNHSVIFAQLPKLDVAGSSPVARSSNRCGVGTYENRLPVLAAGFSRRNGPRNGSHAFDVWGPLHFNVL